MKKSCVAAMALLSICLLLSGCSFSTSSKASSESSSSPSRSSSGEGEQSVQKTASSYQEDVISLTILYVGSAGSSLDFQRELGQISTTHGIVDWGNNPETFKAIGIGLKRAKVPSDSVKTLLFLQGLDESPHYQEIQNEII